MLVTPVDRERPRRHVAAEPGGVRQHPAADARVDVAADAARGGRGAAISVTGSTTPCAYDGALATTSTVRSSIAAAIAAGSARKSGADRRPAPARRRSSARPCGTPRARCVGSTMRGRGDVRAARRGRPARRAGTDSVPPEVTDADGRRRARRAGRRRSRPGRSPSAAGSGTRSGRGRWTPAYAATRLAADSVGVGAARSRRRRPACGRRATGRSRGLHRPQPGEHVGHGSASGRRGRRAPSRGVER